MRPATVGAALCVFLFAAEEKLLFDFRTSPTNSVPKLAPEVQRNLLFKVFPHHLEKQSDCEEDEPLTEAALEAARKSGHIVPQLVSQAAGSFTNSGASQTAYLIKVGECSARVRSYFGTYRLAVFENGQLVAAGQSLAGDYIEAVADVDGDGRKEILIAGCRSGQGVVDCSAALLSMVGGSLRIIEEFPSVYVDQCESSQDFGIHATLIRYAPGSPARFFRHEYVATCPGPGHKPEFRPAAGHN